MKKEKQMTKKEQRKTLKTTTPLKGSKKKQRSVSTEQNPQESKWQEFLRRHSGSTEKK